MITKHYYYYDYYYYYYYYSHNENIDVNENEIYEKGGLKPIVEGLEYARDILLAPVPSHITSKEYMYIEDLGAQSARCLRNMSCKYICTKSNL